MRNLFRLKYWLYALLLVAFVVGGVALYFSMIDWNKNKQVIANRFSEVTGKTVEFDGPVSFQLLPSPYLSAEDVKVYSTINGEKKLLAKAKNLIANLSLYPLIKGNFEVTRMAIVEPNITFEVTDGNKFNWYTELSEDQKYALETTDVTLESMTIEKARVRFLDEARGIDFVLDNLNAEIMADTLMGPYSIDGSYMRGGNMEGFAIKLGSLLSSFETKIDFVINYPEYESYVRFDGSVLPNNYAINGSVIVESAKIADFLNGVVEGAKVDVYYNKPLALSMELNTNQTQTNLNNVVIKYGNTVGAGSVVIPRGYSEIANTGGVKKKIQAVFNMTDLDFEPVAFGIEKFIDKYSFGATEYVPNFDYDMSAEIKAVKTTYKGQVLRDFNLALDLVDNVVLVKNFEVSMPGETTLKTTAEFFPSREEVGFRADTVISTANFDKLAEWMGYKVEPVAQATYKKMDAKFSSEGTLGTIKIAPLQVSFDKTIIDGEMGIVRGSSPSLFVALNADAINLDNYMQAYAPSGEEDKGLVNVINYYFAKLGVLNDYDVKGILSVGLIIADGVPVENINVDFDVKDGYMKLTQLDVGQFSNASIELKGGVSGFGETPKFDNLAYKIKTQDGAGLLSRLGFDISNLNLSDSKNIVAEGTLSGSLDDADMNVDAGIGNVSTLFKGKIQNVDGIRNVQGYVEIKAPDFVKFVNDMGYKYNPNVFSLGLFNFKGNIEGNLQKFSFGYIDANVGANSFKGKIDFDSSSGRNVFDVDIQNNKFELDRFLYNQDLVGAAKEAAAFRPTANERGDFLSKPFLSKAKMNYDVYKNFDMKGKISSMSLSYKNIELKNTSFDMALDNGQMTLGNLIAEYDGGYIRGNMDFSLASTSLMKGNLTFNEQTMIDANWAGKKYGFSNGKYNSTIVFETSIDSEEAVLANLNAEVNFNARDLVFKGWDLAAVKEDLKGRKQSDGVTAMIRSNLVKGETMFDNASGKIMINNASFNFENVKLENKDVIVDISNDGSFNNWNMNAKMKANFRNDDNVPEVKFSMTGAIISPVVSVESDDLVKVYDSYWEQLAEERKKLKQAEYDNLTAMMAEQQQIAKDSQARIHSVIADFTSKRQKSDNVEVINYYEDSIRQLEAANNDIEEVYKLGAVNDFDTNLIEEIKLKNNDIISKIDRAGADVSSIYSRDVRTRVNESYNRIVDVYGVAQASIADYREMMSEFGKRLAKAQSKENIDENEKIVGFESNIEQAFLDVDDINQRIRKNYIFIQNTNDLNKLEKYAEEMKGLEGKEKEGLDNMNKSIKTLKEYMEAFVAKEEKAYADKLRNEEIQKKVEENTGKIEVVGREKVITVVRGIDDIEKAEEEVKKEGVRVLDFSGDKSVPSGKVISRSKTVSYEKVQVSGEPKVETFIRQIGDDQPVEKSGEIVIRSAK